MKAKKKGEMATKVSNFSDLIQRVAASCLLHPLAAGRQDPGDVDGADDAVIEEDPDEEEYYEYDNSSEDEEKENGVEKSRRVTTRVWDNNGEKKELVMLMEEVFEAVAEMKKAYVRLQEAHCPWDPERMRAADVAVVGELRRIGVLRERFRRGTRGGGGGSGRKGHSVGMLREVVAPYEAAVEDLKKEVKVKGVEIENLKEKLNTVTCLSNGGKKGRSLSRRKVSCSQGKFFP